MQGILIDGNRRPASKKEVKQMVAESPSRVWIEATSFSSAEFYGQASSLDGCTVYFVGPDPYTSRKFYGTIRRVNGQLKVA